MNEMRPSDKFAAIKWIVLVAGLIAGIICGNVFSVPVSMYDSEFNSGMMLIVWICALIGFVSFYAVSAHLKNQETIIDIMINETKK